MRAAAVWAVICASVKISVAVDISLVLFMKPFLKNLFFIRPPASATFIFLARGIFFRLFAINAARLF